MSSSARITLDPKDLSIPELYGVLLTCVSPRPIAFVSTVSEEGIPNLAPFSYFMAGGANPPSVCISPVSDRNGKPKDTLVNIQATREFTINIVTYDVREKMNQTSAEYPAGVSEWEKAGFTPEPSADVRPVIVAECPLAMECRLFQVVNHGGQPLSANYVIGEVVKFHISKHVMDGDKIDPLKVEYISRMSGDWYARANADSMFELGRPARPGSDG
ncbi:MAG: flavin reductase family protein [Chthonomonadales bacterium]